MENDFEHGAQFGRPRPAHAFARRQPRRDQGINRASLSADAKPLAGSP